MHVQHRAVLLVTSTVLLCVTAGAWYPHVNSVPQQSHTRRKALWSRRARHEQVQVAQAMHKMTVAGLVA